MDTLWQDLRYAIRGLLRNRGFSVVAVVILGLGIGANTAVFTVINTLFLRSLPVKSPQELVQMSAIGAAARRKSGPSRRNHSFPYPLYERLRDGARSMSGLFAAGGVGRDRFMVVGTADAEAEFVRDQVVSGNFFSVLGVPASLGRTLTAEDDRSDHPQAAAVISHGFWNRRFGADPSVVGKAVTLNEVRFTIVGVAPPGFFGFQPGDSAELWWPLQMAPQVFSPDRFTEGQWWLRLVGRVPTGVDPRRAQAELEAIFRPFLVEFTERRQDKWTPSHRQAFVAQKLELGPSSAGWTELRDRFRQPLLILMAVVALVLLIGCANVASLLVARAAARAREFSLRGALGAGRLRLVRQLLTESALLAALGGLLGLLLARGGTRVLLAFMQLESDPISFSVAPDARVLLFTTAASLLTALFFGLAPAFRSSRLDLMAALKGAAPGSAGKASKQKLGQALVVTQVALSLTLLIGAGLFVRTLRNLNGQDLGFDRKNVVQFDLEFAQRVNGERRNALYKELLARLESLPGVQAASLFGSGFLSGNWWSERISAEGYVSGPDEDLDCHGVMAGPRVAETFGMPLLFGRDLGPSDERATGTALGGAQGTALINEAMARRYFGDVNPVGKRFHFAHRPEQKVEIVGVVKDAKYRSLRDGAIPTFYVPYFQEPRSQGMSFVLRTGEEPRRAMALLGEVVRAAHPAARLRDLQTLDDVVSASLHQERVVAELGGFFSLFALWLTCLGLYGMLSFAVVQRTREIGVRVALGAQKRDVLYLVAGQGLRLAVLGAALGVGAALALTRFVSNLLYGVTAADPATFVGVPLLLLVVATVASSVPALRAARVDPTVALRCE